FGGDRPGAVTLIVGDILQRRAPQTASRREKRDRLQAIGLAGAVRPHQHHDVAARLYDSRAVVAEVREGKAVDARGRHEGASVFSSPLPLWERVAPHEVRRRVRGILPLGKLYEN